MKYHLSSFFFTSFKACSRFLPSVLIILGSPFFGNKDKITWNRPPCFSSLTNNLAFVIPFPF